MAAVFDWFGRWRAPAAANVPAAAPPAVERSPDQMIAGCEYELRQMRRDVVATREERSARPVIAREPFVLGVRLRNEDFRAKLRAVAGSRARKTGSGAH